jgi:predicted small metal-binding protein
MDVNCSHIGADCDHVLQGNSMDELVENAAGHAVQFHNCSVEIAETKDWREQMKGAIRNASRPAHLRASGPPVPPHVVSGIYPPTQ